MSINLLHYSHILNLMTSEDTQVNICIRIQTKPFKHLCADYAHNCLNGLESKCQVVPYGDSTWTELTFSGLSATDNLARFLNSLDADPAVEFIEMARLSFR